MLNLEQDFYMLVLDLGKLGHVFQEADFAASSEKDMLEYLKTDNDDVVKVIRFNPVENTSRDVTEDMAIDVWDAIKGTTERFHDVPDFVTNNHPDLFGNEESFQPQLEGA